MEKTEPMTNAELGAAVRRLWSRADGCLSIAECPAGVGIDTNRMDEHSAGWEGPTLSDAIRAAVRAMEERGDG